MAELSIRHARPGDEALILTLLRELADYEKLLDVFHVTEEVIRRDYLGPQPLVQCELAFDGDAPVGVMTWYWTYSSFAAKRSIYLEDLFVRQSARGRGHGKALLVHLAKTRGCRSGRIASNGRCSTGTSRRSSSTTASAHGRCMAGTSIAWKATL